MRKRAIAAALTVIGASLIWTAGALAAPMELTVRIEGKEKTLFEGPILTEGHDVRASSDTEPHHCDGTNNGAHPAPVATPTAASADAMELAGQSFDGDWYPGFDDYFITRWGPDSEDLGAGAFWGILVNGVLTPIGGCQYGDEAGDEVLWAYDAFSGRRLLWLAAASDPTLAPAAPLPTAHVEVGEPLALEVDGYIGGEGSGAEVKPAAGVSVAPVETEAGSGFETVETADPAAVSTAADGSAEISFAAPGWQRLKAQKEAGFIRSNRLDVCVEPVGGGACGPLPADAQLRVPDRYDAPAPKGEPPAGPPASGGDGKDPVARPAGISLGRALVDAKRGTARLSVALPGPGRVVLSGRRVRKRVVAVGVAGTVWLEVRPTVAARAVLARAGGLRVDVTLAFTPSGGSTGSVRRSLTLRLVSQR